ncbi:hypothetical protein KEM09_16775 [Carboxylicivirga mesophila]|uniref:DUF4783 domain-containing protein n=2 Tax=Carboxylicivirga TaxID=1628153 RepID=A0A941IXR4_9BACT|nr:MULTISPECIES: hypothetical protein [Carboxylicivirga]MBR8537091.1 hypothetical protein [Carboxylicivirga sediminis]MBS2213075.1 hypothetical protein [Carboxylicivirga mesophila]
MKKIFYSFFILFIMSGLSASAQCGDDLLKTALKEMGATQYIKDFTVEMVKERKDVKTGYVKFSVVLNSNTQYKFNIVNGASNAEQMIMQLKQNEKLISSNFHNGKMYDEFQFICRKTGVYHLYFSFKGGQEGCAKAVLSLVKQL